MDVVSATGGFRACPGYGLDSSFKTSTNVSPVHMNLLAVPTSAIARRSIVDEPWDVRWFMPSVVGAFLAIALESGLSM